MSLATSVDSVEYIGKYSVVLVSSKATSFRLRFLFLLIKMVKEYQSEITTFITFYDDKIKILALIYDQLKKSSSQYASFKCCLIAVIYKRVAYLIFIDVFCVEITVVR